MASRDHYFAVDLMSYIAWKYNLDWAPLEEQKPASPFTNLMKSGIDVYLQLWDYKIIEQSREIIASCRGNSMQFRQILHRCFVDNDITEGKENHFFLVISGLARFASILYIHGMLSAPDVAVDVIENALSTFQHEFQIDIYQNFDTYCLFLTVCLGQ